MILETLYIGSFGKLSNLTVELKDGINIIRGENEAGKSTICNFIKFIFYGLSGRSEEKQHYISWNTSTAGGYIIAREGEKRYRIEREVICASGADGKPSYRERAAIAGMPSGDVLFRGQNAGEVFFGVPADVFESTVYIGQLGDSRVGGRTLAESTENILFSGSESLSAKRALKKLDDARVFLMYKNRRGGKLFDLQNQCDQLSARLAESQKASGDMIFLEGLKRELSEKLEKSKSRLAECSASLSTYEKYSLRGLYLKRREEALRLKETEALGEKLRLAENYGGVQVFSDNYINMLEELSRRTDTAAARHDSARTALDEANRKVSDMSEKIDVFKRLGPKSDSLVKATEKHISRAKTMKLLGIISAILAIGCGAAAAAGFITSAISETVSIIFAVMLGIFGAAAICFSSIGAKSAGLVRKNCRTLGCKSAEELFELHSAASRDEAVLTYITESKTKAEENEKLTSDEFDAANAKIAAKLTEAHFPIEGSTRASLAEALKICRKEKSGLEKLAMIINEQKSKVGEIDGKLRSYDEGFLREALSGEYDEEKMKSFDEKTERRNQEFLQNSVVAMTEKLAQTDKDLAVLLATTQRPTEISEALEASKHELAVLSDKFDAYVLAIDSIESASGKLREGISPKIAKNASSIMNELSLGKYDTVCVDTDFEMTFTDGAVTRPAGQLSAGTTDLVYVSLRLALADVLFGKSKPPFIFDESFSRTDDNRLSAALSMIRRFCENGDQAILFTCHGREEKMMSSVGDCNLIKL